MHSCSSRRLYRNCKHEIAPDLQPNPVIADFDEAPAAALRAVYGNDLTASGCWFHYGQAIMKVETPEEDRSDGGIPELGNNASGIPLSACTTAAAGYRPSIPGRQVLMHDDTPSKTLLLQLSLRRASVAQQVIHWRSTNVRPRQSRAH